MVLLAEGLNRLRDLHGADIDYGQMGTDGTAATESQTGLIAPISSAKILVTTSTATKTLVVNYTCPSTAATGNTFREFVTMKDGSADYNRITFTGIEHTASDDIVIRQTFFYRNPEST